MPSLTQNITATSLPVLDNSTGKSSALVKSLIICNRTAGVITYSVVKTVNAVNFNLYETVNLAAKTTIVFTNIYVDAGVVLSVAASGSADVDCNYEK
ncbi:MAG: hypothetical protein IT236_05845 [Bacteroidia bacterium]|nr:hypothetical protein [Bacteroidia bacterium]